MFQYSNQGGIKMKKIVVIALALAILIVGTVMAVDPIPATTETQGITSSTSTVFYGTMTNSESTVWTESNLDLRNNPVPSLISCNFRSCIRRGYLTHIR